MSTNVTSSFSAAVHIINSDASTLLWLQRERHGLTEAVLAYDGAISAKLG
jgi:hypothetical protein